MRRRVLGLGMWLMGACGWGCAASTNASAPGADAAQRADAVVLDVGEPARDVGMAASEQPIVGRWRAVRYRGMVNGQLVEFTDTAPGDQPFARRVNGVMIVRTEGLRMNVGLFGAQGPIPFASQTGRDVSWLHQLRVAEGRWRARADGFTFEDARTPAEDPLRFVLDADGLLWMATTAGPPGETFSLGFARDPNPARLAQLELTAPVLWLQESEPSDALRPALLWDVPGANLLAQSFTLGAWTGAPPQRRNSFMTTLGTSPGAMFQARVGGVAVAVAYPAVYTDADRDGQLGPAERVAMDPSLAIVWRGEGPDDALRGTTFEGFLPGYSFALPHWIIEGRPAITPVLVPFDNTVPPNFTLRSDISPDPRARLADFVP